MFTGFAMLFLVLQAAPAPPTPQDCVQRGRDFMAQRRRELGPMTGDVARKLEAERLELVRGCAAPFDVEKAQGRELVGLAELYNDAQQPELARRAIARGLESAALSVGERADLLVSAVRWTLRQPKSDERIAQAEAHMQMLDALAEETIEQKTAAHGVLNSYYRGDDVDAGIIRHSTWLIDAARRLSPEQRSKHGSALVGAYVYMAEALAGQGENDRALDLLARAPAELPGVPNVESRSQAALLRYRLVGTPAAPVAAPVWLNAPEGTRAMELKGRVTLLQFTAHWCGPCKESYPGIQRLRTRFGERGFRVVFATELYGYFGAERPLTPAQEIEKDRSYFAGLGLDVPIAIGPGRVAVDGQRARAKDPNAEAYRVGGIPQITLIDKRGDIRLIMVGYDDANEPKLAAFIEKLLTEPPPGLSQ